MRVRRVVVLCMALAGTLLTGCSAPAPTEANHAGGRILSVADGDTLTVGLPSGAIRRVRLLAIDSPEKYATRYGTPDECGSVAASAFLQRYRGSRVVLVGDPSQGDGDRYGRWLRYVQLTNGEDLGAAEVARGLAMPYLFDSPARRYRRYRTLAIAARAAGRGSWGPPCEGDFHSSVSGVQNGL